MSANHQHNNNKGHSNSDALHVGCGAQPPAGAEDQTPFRWNPQERIKRPGLGKWQLSLYNAERFHAGNVTLLQRGKKFIVIDSGCSRNYALINKKLARKKNTSFFLINTHAHPDHTGGNEQMARQGAIVVSHRNAREHMIRYEIPKKPGLPVVTFDKQIELHAGNQKIDLIGLPPGHTSGDIAVWIPGLNILHTGDTFMSEDYPLIDLNTNGTINGLIRSVSIMIKRINADTTVIPGHGNLANKNDLKQYRRMLRNVRSEVEKYKNEGLTVEAVKDLDLTQKYDHRWGKGHLISGRQFVERVYKSLPEDASSRSTSALRPKQRTSSTNKISSDFDFYTDHIHARTTKRGDALIRWTVDDQSDLQTEKSNDGILIGPEKIGTIAKQISDGLIECKPRLSIKHMSRSEGVSESPKTLDMTLAMKSMRYQNNRVIIKAEPLLASDQGSAFSTEGFDDIAGNSTISIGWPDCP